MGIRPLKTVSYWWDVTTRSHKEKEGKLFSRIEGDNTVLEVYHFSHNSIIPMAWEGYALFMEPTNDILQEGKIIKFPNEKVRIHLFKSFHYARPAIHELSGEIKILEIKPKYVVIQLNIASPDSEWKLYDVGKFKLTEIRKIND